MDPGDLLIFRVLWAVFDTSLIGGRRSVFFTLFIILIWVSIIGALVLLEPGSLLLTVLVGGGICASIAAGLISVKTQRKRHP